MSEVVPIPSASALVLRDDPFAVLMVRRVGRSSFAPGLWVFPGGVLDAADRDAGGAEEPLLPFAICALREVYEETGLLLGRGAGATGITRAGVRSDAGQFIANVADWRERAALLVPAARWITPVALPKRFDTWFFLARHDQPDVATPDESECDAVEWLGPRDALRRFTNGTFPLMFPTVRILESIEGFTSSVELIESRRGIRIRPILPVIVDEEQGQRVVITSEEE